jgi:hypothetical protein
MFKKIWNAVNGSKTKIGLLVKVVGETLSVPLLSEIGDVLIIIGGGHAATKAVKSVKGKKEGE